MRAAEVTPLERSFLTAPIKVTEGMVKAGEGYFSPDSSRICYQAVPADYPFYQIFVQLFDAAAPRPAVPQRISTGRGRTQLSLMRWPERLKMLGVDGGGGISGTLIPPLRFFPAALMAAT